jgi:heme-degrading monooxygenase HmoA
MIEVIFRYQVHPSQVRAFEHAYGSAGPWAGLFRKYRGYRRTRLFRHKQQPELYICVDVWDAKADYDAFRASAADEYARMSREFRMLYIEELLLGYYEGDQEYLSHAADDGLDSGD